MDGPTLFDKLLTKHGLNPNRLANDIGLPSAQSGFDRFRKGQIKRPTRMVGLDLAAKRLGVNVAAFYDADLAENEWQRINAGDSASATLTTQQAEEASGELTINEYDTGGKMGHGLVLKDQPGVIRRWVVSPDWVQQNVHRITSPSNLAIVTGFGDSMRPLYNPGDPLLIDRGVTRADIDGIYFFRVGEEGYVKRLQRIPTADGVIIRAKSDNEKYDPFDIVKGMDFEVFGRVVKAWRGEEF